MFRRYYHHSLQKLGSSNLYNNKSSSAIIGNVIMSSFKSVVSSSTSDNSSKQTPAFESVTLKSSSTSTKIPLSISYGSADMRGRRDSMEDAHFNIVDYYNNKDKSTNQGNADNNNLSIFGILDGHCGASVACRAAELLPDKVFSDDNKKELISSVDQMGKVMVNAVLDVDDILCQAGYGAGACMIFSVVHADERRLAVAGLGDCNAFLVEGDANTAVSLNNEHKPNAPKEKARVERCGGRVFHSCDYRFGRYLQSIYRVSGSGSLSLARALGDFSYKNLVKHKSGDVETRIVDRQQESQMSNVADIFSINITDATKYMVLGCDGLFDVMKEKEDIIPFVNKYFQDNQKELTSDPQKTLDAAAKALINEAYREGSMDNISATIVLFHHPKDQTFGGQKKKADEPKSKKVAASRKAPLKPKKSSKTNKKANKSKK